MGDPNYNVHGHITADPMCPANDITLEGWVSDPSAFSTTPDIASKWLFRWTEYLVLDC
ncbi:MAG: hypothetical protein ABJA67_10145 [Chthonomonadales bacterium]